MTEREYMAVVEHLKIPLSKAQEVRQLDLFENVL